MDGEPPLDTLRDRAVGTERAFVLATGGYSLEISGASLVTHERIPVPRFNFISVGRVGADRQTAIFERALDHYFQRALRPSIRVAWPVPEYVDKTVRGLAFHPRPEPHTLLWSRPRSGEEPASGIEVRRAEPEELDLVLGFWTDGPHRAELRRALEVAWSRPTPEERLIPLLAESEGESVGSTVVLVRDAVASLHGLAARPGSHAAGVLSSLLSLALRLPETQEMGAVVVASDRVSLESQLTRSGFVPLRRYVEYELAADAQLTMPDPGPAQPARWRPPRAPSPGTP
ncbi:MAG: hypothetical protein L3K05_07220 [Thermoplasmata archaeon]|nr:hypothetical protein [Thermoplasmata archaeon]